MLPSTHHFVAPLLLTIVSSRFSEGKTPPAIAEQFSVRVTEVDDTDDGSVTLRQTIVFDMLNKRSHMTADGRLTNGHLEQIKRCDLGSGSYFLDIEGAPNSSVGSWACKNMSIPDPGSTCQYQPFFPTLSNASYEGVVVCPQNFDSSKCDKWTYWQSNEKYAWWTLANSSVPVRLAKTIADPNHPSYHLWHLNFDNFKPGPPNASLYRAPTGLRPCQEQVEMSRRGWASTSRDDVSGKILLPNMNSFALPEKGCKSTDVPLQSYHIHVLFDPSNSSRVDEALRLQSDFMRAFALIGKENCSVVAGDPAPWIKDICAYEIDWAPAGPFVTAQYSFFVPVDKLTKAVAWTVRHRGNLDILVHPNSGCELEDHTSWAMWGGSRWDINADAFTCEYPGCVPKDFVYR